VTNKSISVCIPVYNEEHTIKQVVDKAFSVVSNITADHEVIVVNDGSTDQTEAILEEAINTYDNLVVINNKRNLGKEPALKAMFSYATKEYIFSIDADLQTPMGVLYKMNRAVDENGYDIVLGVKINKHSVYTYYRRIISYLYNYSVSRLFDVHIKDAGGVKFAKSAIYKMPVYSKGVFADAERVIRTAYAGYLIGMVDVYILPRFHGKATASNIKAVLIAIKDMLKLFAMKGRVRGESQRICRGI
jgi:glycosyltransferase involved in cell wall biosynthesis